MATTALAPLRAGPPLQDAEPGGAPDRWVQVGPRGDKKWRDRGIGSPDTVAPTQQGSPP